MSENYTKVSNMNTEDVMICMSFSKDDVEVMDVLAEALECDVTALVRAMVLNFGKQLSIAVKIDEKVLAPAILSQLSEFINPWA